MSQSFRSSRVSIPGTISTNGFVWSYRTRATVGLKTETTLPGSRASAQFPSASGTPPFASVIANLHSRIGVLLAGRLDRGGPHGDRLPASFFPRQGTFSGIVNFCRPQITAGKCFSFLRSLLKHCQEPCSVDFVLFVKPDHLPQSAPAWGLVARLERHKISKRKIPNGGNPGTRPGKPTARSRNVQS